jgi:nitrite reductase/ring-hydroxylating ferredoxin subunit
MTETHSSTPVPGSKSPRAQSGASSPRRRFLWLTFGWLASLFAIVASGFAGLRSLIPNVLFEPSRRFKAGWPDDYQDGTFTFIEEVRLFIARNGNNFRAMSAVCPHLGCTVNLMAAKHPFLCPCHGSHFDLKGNALTGPSPGGLSWYHVSLSKDGRLVIDLDREVNHDRVLIV